MMYFARSRGTEAVWASGPDAPLRGNGWYRLRADCDPEAVLKFKQALEDCYSRRFTYPPRVPPELRPHDVLKELKYNSETAGFLVTAWWPFFADPQDDRPLGELVRLDDKPKGGGQP